MRYGKCFGRGGITNPLSVIEQITYMLFMKQLDEQQTKQERRARMDGIKITKQIFDEDNSEFRWSNFKNKTDSLEMFNIVKDKAFPHMKGLGGADSKLARHLDNAVFMIPSPQLLQRVVTAIDKMLEEMSERSSDKHNDSMGDLYEYLLSKISTAGTNGQFRTPRHIIKMMVELLQPSLGDNTADYSNTGGAWVLSILVA